MPLDGLRAWIGEVERKLGMRTRVFLVLTAIAIGGAGAAIYLALDTRDAAVSEGDVRVLQEKLEAELRALEAKVDEARGGSGGPAAGTETTPTPAPDTSGAVPDTDGEASDDGIATDDPQAKARLQDFLGE